MKLNCATWNIRRGLLTREKELVNLLATENIDLIFITETDTKNIKKEEDYTIQGYKTILPLFNSENQKIRIIGLVKTEISTQFKFRQDLMSVQFPSIWLEYSDTNNKNQTLFAGFYREWSHEGLENEMAQSLGLDVFINQMEKASSECEKIIICGDANLCSLKWKDEKYLKKKYAIPILETLTSCNLINQDIGITFLADHSNKDGNISESAIDHVYVSESINSNVNSRRVLNTASDHFPVIISYAISVPKATFKTNIQH